MIQPEELRIGNLIEFEGRYLPVLAIDSQNTLKWSSEEMWKGSVHLSDIIDSYDMGTISKWCNKINPIPLTEEWLLKLGFDKVKSNYEEAETYDWYLGVIYFDMANQSTKINGKYCLSFIPEHVHQLMNLYYSLTGQELTAKE